MEEPLGWNERFGGYVIPVPSNMHVHFRFDPAMMELVIQETAKHYRYVTAMPNFGEDRIRIPEQAIAYRERVLTIARKYDPNFNLNVPLYLEPNTSPDTVREGFELGAWIAAKLYPRGGTNGSEEGVDFQKLCELEPVFKTMEELGMLLLIHAEPTEHKDGSGIVNWKREQASLGLIGSILRKHSNLHVVFEHISSAAGARAIRQWQRKGCRVEATIAPQYLLWNATKLFAGGMNPLYYSIPILKEEEDRLALITFLLEGGGFLGTDSAPHDLKAKQQGYRCPGGHLQ